MRLGRFVLVLLVTTCTAPLAALPAGGAGRTTRPAPSAVAMVRIPAGAYRPLYSAPSALKVQVARFTIDRVPVTRGDFHRFVRSHPSWARDAVRPSFAERAYLADWPSSADAGSGDDLRRPVTGVSWFAAKAYCEAQGKRLPTVDEWEYVAGASETVRDASTDQRFLTRLLALYAARQPGRPGVVGSTFTNRFGVSDLHGLVWEWTHDFNMTAAAAERSHTSSSTGSAHIHHPFCASAAIGSSSLTNYPAFLRYAVRGGLSTRSTLGGLGFRCASSAG